MYKSEFVQKLFNEGYDYDEALRIAQDANLSISSARFHFSPDTPKLKEPQHQPISKIRPSIVQTRTTRWFSNAYQYVKTQVSSPDYDIALAEGYEIFDKSEDGLRVFRRRNRGAFTLSPETPIKAKAYTLGHQN